MSQALAALQALANEAALESGIDMNEAVKGGGGRLLPAGYAFGRIVEYVEYGNQPQEFNGQKKEPALEFHLGFALWGDARDAAGNVVGHFHNDDGTPYIIRTYNTAMSRNEKANAFKLFKTLNWTGTKVNFGQFIGEAYLVPIVHVPKSKADPKIVSRIDMARILPPLDAVSKQPYPIPAAADDLYRFFLWEKPTKEGWDRLYVEGQYEAAPGKPAASKNRIQETILGALDFQGSPLQLLLAGLGIQVNVPVQAAAATVAVPAVAVPAQVSAPVAVPSVAVAAPAVSVPNVAVAPATVPAAGVVVAPAPVSAPTTPASMSVPVIASPSEVPAVPQALPATVAAPVAATQAAPLPSLALPVLPA